MAAIDSTVTVTLECQTIWPDQNVRCTTCEHSFDAMDDRCWISSKAETSPALCPLCNTLLRSTPEWAIWNDCNGIFEVMPRRAAALQEAKDRYANCGVTVVAARAFVEPGVQQWLRSLREDEHERIHAKS